MERQLSVKYFSKYCFMKKLFSYVSDNEYAPDVKGLYITRLRPRKNSLFPVTVGKKTFFNIISLVKNVCFMHVFFVDWELGGRKKL